MHLRYSGNILLLAFFLAFFSCDRIKNKGNAVIDKTRQVASETKQKISDRKDRLVDKIFPAYNSGKADTESNKKRFREHLGVELTPDVKNIYAYGDFLGADYKVLLAFTCNQATADRIIAAQNMQWAGSRDHGLLFPDEFNWWDKEKIELLTPYKAGKEDAYWKYLWYDGETKKAFYEEYSL